MDDDEGAGERTPRRAGITTISEATHTSRGRAAAILKAAGMRKGADGKFLFEKGCEVIWASIDPARSLAHQVGGDDSALDDKTAGTIGAAWNAKARFDELRCQKLEQENDIRAGNLIRRDDVIALAKDVGAHVRTNVLAVAPKVAAACIGKDAEQIQSILTDALRTALIRLTDTGDYLMGTTT